MSKKQKAESDSQTKQFPTTSGKAWICQTTGNQRLFAHALQNSLIKPVCQMVTDCSLWLQQSKKEQQQGACSKLTPPVPPYSLSLLGDQGSLGRYFRFYKITVAATIKAQTILALSQLLPKWQLPIQKDTSRTPRCHPSVGGTRTTNYCYSSNTTSNRQMELAWTKYSGIPVRILKRT